MKISNFWGELIPGAPAPSQKLENTEPAQPHHLPRRIQLLLPKMPLPAHPQLYIPNSSLKSLPKFIPLHPISEFGYLEWAAPSNTQIQVEISTFFPSYIYHFHCVRDVGGPRVLQSSLTEAQEKKNGIESSIKENSNFPNWQIL